MLLENLIRRLYSEQQNSDFIDISFLLHMIARYTFNTVFNSSISGGVYTA